MTRLRDEYQAVLHKAEREALQEGKRIVEMWKKLDKEKAKAAQKQKKAAEGNK